MLRSKKYLVALAILAAVSVFTALTAILGHVWLPQVGLAALLFMIAVICLDTNRQSRSKYARRPAAPAPRPSVSSEDLIGTMRLLQAQYVGRLDRSQAALEEATAALLTASSTTSPPDGTPAEPLRSA